MIKGQVSSVKCQVPGAGCQVSRAKDYVPRITHYALRFKWICLAVLVPLIVLALWGWLVLPDDDGTLADIQTRGTLRVGLDASFPPFEMVNGSDEIVGLDVDIARAIAADLGVEAEFVNIGFDGLYDALLARRVDLVLSGLPYDPRWTKDVAYTHNYFNAGEMLVTLANNTAINTLEDLAGHTLAVEWGSQADMEGRRLAHEINALELLRQESAEAALEALFNGEADAAIVDAVSGARAFPRGLRIITYVSDDWYVGAVHVESQALLAAVNQSLTQLNESGRMAQMQAQWLHGQ